MIICTIAFVAVIAVFLKFVWFPWRQQKWYVRQFEKAGYRVLEIPFRPFATGMEIKLDVSGKVEDALKFVKDRYPHHDVVIMNLVHRICIEFLSPDFIQEFHSADSQLKYEKFYFLKELMMEGCG